MMAMDHLARPAPPWVLLSTCTFDSLKLGLQGHFPGLALRQIRGEFCRTKSSLFTEFSRALQFPEYFGRNWDAFDECIKDLEWIGSSGYVIAVTKAEQVLADAEAEYGMLVETLSDAGKQWAAPTDERPATPFHVILIVSSPEDAHRRNWQIGDAQVDSVIR